MVRAGMENGGIEGHRGSAMAHINAVAIGEQAQQYAADLVPHGAGKTTSAPFPAAAGGAPPRGSGLVMCQGPPQRSDGPGVVTGSLQFPRACPTPNRPTFEPGNGRLATP